MAFWAKKKEEKEVAEPADLSKFVVQYLHEGVLIVDEAENISLLNGAAEKMLRKAQDEMLGINFEACITLVDIQGKIVEKNPIHQAIASGEYVERKDLKLRFDDGATAEIAVAAAPTGAAGSPVVVTLRNIEKELAEARARSEFISTASHEMRTPVASIEGYLSLTLNPSTATIDERAREYIEKAQECSKHLGQLFQELLDASKLDDGLLTPDLHGVEIATLTKNIADGLAPKAQEKGLEYSFGAAEERKRMSPLFYAKVDPVFWREIVENLLENAVKYTPAGFVRVKVEADDKTIEMSVEDSGIGIEEKDLGHVFQKFYRADNSDTREIGGTGLGLFLVAQRVAALNGHIRVESELGKGAKFVVSLPRISAEEFRQMQEKAAQN